MARAARRLAAGPAMAWAMACLALFAPGNCAGAAQIEVEANRQRIYLGESFVLTVSVENLADENARPELDATMDARAEVQYFGASTSQMSYLVNGRGVSRISRRFTYSITPRMEGSFQVGAVKMRIGGREESVAGPSVTVIGLQEQNYLKAELSLSRETSLVEEPFTVTLSVTIPKLKEPNAHVDPLWRSPLLALTIPYLDPQADLSGLNVPKISDILQPILVNGQNNVGGFSINNQTLRSDPFANPFSFSFEPIPAVFRPGREEATWGDGRPAWRYVLPVAFSASSEGNYTFGPVTVKGPVVTGVSDQGQGIVERIFTIAPAVTMRVVPPPEEGRPAGFVGCIGTNCVVETSLDTQRCRQGDPLKLSLSISGAITLSNLRAPLLSGIVEGLGDSFRVYEDSIQAADIPGGRKFTYTVRPLRHGTIEFPPLPISYYDTAERKYVTVSSPPIPLMVDEVAEFSEADIFDATGDSEGGGELSVSFRDTVPAAITMSAAGALPAAPITSWWSALWLLPGPLLLLLVSGARAILRDSALRRARRRAKSAARVAGRAIARARDGQQVIAAVARFFGDRFGAAASGFAPSDVEIYLGDNFESREISGEIVRLIQPVFDRSFANDGDAAGPEDLEDVKARLPGLLSAASAALPIIIKGGAVK